MNYQLKLQHSSAIKTNLNLCLVLTSRLFVVQWNEARGRGSWLCCPSRGLVFIRQRVDLIQMVFPRYSSFQQTWHSVVCCTASVWSSACTLKHLGLNILLQAPPSSGQTLFLYPWASISPCFGSAASVVVVVVASVGQGADFIHKVSPAFFSSLQIWHSVLWYNEAVWPWTAKHSPLALRLQNTAFPEHTSFLYPSSCIRCASKIWAATSAARVANSFGNSCLEECATEILSFPYSDWSDACSDSSMRLITRMNKALPHSALCEDFIFVKSSRKPGLVNIP